MVTHCYVFLIYYSNHTWPSRSRNYRCRFRIWCFWPCMMVSVPFWYRWLWFSKYRSRIGPGDFDFPQCRSRLVSLIDDCISNQSLAPSRRKIITSCLVCDWTTAKTSQRTYWSVLLLEPLQLSADSTDGRPDWLREVRLGCLPGQLAATHHTAIHSTNMTVNTQWFPSLILNKVASLKIF